MSETTEKTRQPLSFTMSITRKVNLGNYESADFFLSVQGVTSDTSEAEIDNILATQGQLVYRKLAAEVTEKVRHVIAANKAAKEAEAKAAKAKTESKAGAA